MLALSPAADEADCTPLHIAADVGDGAACEALLAHGADPMRMNEDGDMPVDVASDPSIVALLQRDLPPGVTEDRARRAAALAADRSADADAGADADADAPSTSGNVPRSRALSALALRWLGVWGPFTALVLGGGTAWLIARWMRMAPVGSLRPWPTS